MIQTLSPKQAEELIAHDDLDVVDVRDPQEWSAGHVPRARLVPLEQLKATPKESLKRDGVVFVCARGIRSLTAAKLAETLGLTKLYNIDGGTKAWASAGLPLVQG